MHNLFKILKKIYTLKIDIFLSCERTELGNKIHFSSKDLKIIHKGTKTSRRLYL